MSKAYLNVSFREKDEAKKLGAKFDGTKKLWYCPEGINLSLFSKWIIYLNCPFQEKDIAKSRGAHYDGKKKLWYIVPGSNLSRFSRWLPYRSDVEDSPIVIRRRLSHSSETAIIREAPSARNHSDHSSSDDDSEKAESVDDENGYNGSSNVARSPSNKELLHNGNNMAEVYLNVPYHEKDEAYGLGALFNSIKKLWYCPAGHNINLFSKWNIYISCPFHDNDEAKRKGALFDPKHKLWYVLAFRNLEPFTKWLPWNCGVEDTPISRRLTYANDEGSEFLCHPPVFECPMSLKIMSDPVICSDGISYERKYIQEWLRHNNTSPKTNLPFKNKKLIPNITLKDAIETWKQDHRRTYGNLKVK